MFDIRRADERGRAEHGWLSSHHTFSFGGYFDPQHMGFSVLRVINEDRVAPGRGFGAHSHRDMEILSYVLEGELAHKDSMGNGSVLRPGQIQLMSAGRGVTHSEFNHSQDEPLHFLQIWIVPDREGQPSDYQETPFSAELPPNGLRLIVSPDGDAGSLRIKQDTRIHAGRFVPGDKAELRLNPGRSAWIHVARGSIDWRGTALSAGDGVGSRDETELVFSVTSASEVLVFDLPKV